MIDDFVGVKLAFDQAVGELEKKLASNGLAVEMIHMAPLNSKTEREFLCIFQDGLTCEALIDYRKHRAVAVGMWLIHPLGGFLASLTTPFHFA